MGAPTRDLVGNAEGTTAVITKLDNMEATSRETERRLTERLASIQSLLLTLTSCSLQELTLSTAAAASGSGGGSGSVGGGGGVRNSFDASTASTNILRSSSSTLQSNYQSISGEDRFAGRLQKIHQELGLMLQENRRSSNHDLSGPVFAGVPGLSKSLSFSLSNPVGRHSSQTSTSAASLPPHHCAGHEQQLQLLQAQLQQQLHQYPSLQQVLRQTSGHPATASRQVSKDIEPSAQDSVRDQYARAMLHSSNNNTNNINNIDNSNVHSSSANLNNTGNNLPSPRTGTGTPSLGNNNNSSSNTTTTNNNNNNRSLSSSNFQSNPLQFLSQGSPSGDHQVTFAPPEEFGSERAPDGYPPGLPATPASGGDRSPRIMRGALQQQGTMTSIASSTNKVISEFSQNSPSMCRERFGPPLQAVVIRPQQPASSTKFASRSLSFFDHHSAISLSMHFGSSRWEPSFRNFRHPSSGVNVAFRLVGCILLLFDAMLIPYTAAWDLPIEGFLLGFAWASVLYWSLEIISSLFMGYFKESDLVTDPWQIVRRYVTTWFVPDFALVALDWGSLILVLVNSNQPSSAAAVRMLRLAKIGKILRVFVLLRVMRHLPALHEFAEDYLVHVAHSVLAISKVLLFTLWLVHLMACAWYAAGVYGDSDTGVHWISIFDRYPGAGRFTEYVTSFQWALAMVTLGSIDVDASNTLERGVHSMCLLIGLISSSLLVSSLSAAMVEAQLASAERLGALRTLKKYLNENNVNPVLAQAIQKNAAARFRETARLSESDVLVLPQLSTVLRSELRFEILGRPFATHPAFRFLKAYNLFYCQRVLVESLDLVCVQPRDDLFLPSKLAGGSFCLVRGAMKYSQEPIAARYEGIRSIEIDPGSWLSEAALWVYWKHHGRSEAVSRCELLFINATIFHTITEAHEVIQSFVRFYAKVWCKRFRAAPFADDLEVPDTRFCSMVWEMDTAWQREISHIAFQELKNQTSSIRVFWWRNYKQLATELEKGTSVLVVDGTGTVERYVELIIFVLRMQDDREFYELACWEEGRLETCCQYPGGKRERAEERNSAVVRVLFQKFSFLSQIVPQLNEQAIEDTLTTSESQGFTTVYRKHAVRVDLNASLPEALWRATVLEPFAQVRRLSPARSASGMVPSWAVSRPVVFHGDGHGAGRLCAWLSTTEAAYLQSPSGTKDLAAWVESLGIPPPIVTQHADGPESLGSGSVSVTMGSSWTSPVGIPSQQPRQELAQVVETPSSEAEPPGQREPDSEAESSGLSTKDQHVVYMPFGAAADLPSETGPGTTEMGTEMGLGTGTGHEAAAEVGRAEVSLPAPLATRPGNLLSAQLGSHFQLGDTGPHGSI